VDVTTAGTNPWSIQSLHNDWTATPGTDYKVSLFAKSLAAGGSVRIVNQKGSNYWFKDIAPTTTWVEYSWTYTPADPAVQFALNFPTTGTYLIDSITITQIPVVVPTTEPDSLKSLIGKCGISFGTAVADAPLQAETYYQNTLKQHFNMVTPENAMKMDAIKPTETGAYDFAAADRLVAFAAANNMKVRGHTLLWHSQIPQWVTNKAWTKETLSAYLKTYITTVVSHFQGKVAEWDVVNEAIADTAKNVLRNTLYLKTLGVAVFDSAFVWAHAADPNAKLFYNDYSIEDLGDKSDSAFALVGGLVKRKAPIYGVGFQMHRLATESPTFYSELDANIKRMAGLGLKVAITEMDVRVATPATANSYAVQGHNYAEALRTVLKNKSSIETFVTWGITDKYSWVPSVFPGQGDALLFDVNYNAKPAYDSVVAVLKNSCGTISGVADGVINPVLFSYPNPFSHTTTLLMPGQFFYSVYDSKGIHVTEGNAYDRVEIGAQLRTGLYSVVIRKTDASDTKTVKVLKVD
jgi:GH35 family endo-1,4-beta-xylanase